MKPGQKLCIVCKIELTAHSNRIYQNENNELNYEVNENTHDIEKKSFMDTSREQLDLSLTSMDVSPLKMHSIASHSRISHGKKKLKQIQTILNEKQSNLKTHVATILNVNENELGISYNEEVHKELKVKATDMDNLIGLIKDKMYLSNRKQRIQLLTLEPLSWRYEDIVKEFPVTNYMVRSSRRLLNNQGILAEPENKKGRDLSKETISLVQQFYCNDENSCQMPGKKRLCKYFTKQSYAKTVHFVQS